MLLVDASVAVAACLGEKGWEIFGGEELVAPPLLFSETSSALHEAQWRREIPRETARAAITRLNTAPVRIQNPHPLAAWAIADELGWAKTYDAEYVALARQLNCRLVSLDTRLQRGAGRIVEIIGPGDL